MINITRISNKISGLTPTHLMIKGNVQAHNEIIGRFPAMLREFLAGSKNSDMAVSELKDFYLSYFPNLKFDIIQLQQQKANKSVAGCLLTKLNPENFDIESFKLNVIGNGKGFLKNLFSINHKDRIFVSKNFIDTITHETAHLIQCLIKSPLSILQKTLKKHLSKAELNELMEKIHSIYTEQIYLNKHFNRFSPYEFSSDLMKSLNKITKGNKKFQRIILKYFIKEAEREQQAYKIGVKEANLFSHAQNHQIEPDFIYYKYFEPKIQIMKEEYFKLAKQMKLTKK